MKHFFFVELVFKDGVCCLSHGNVLFDGDTFVYASEKYQHSV